MYISLWENSRGHPDNVSFMQQKLMVSNKKIHRALRTHTTLMNNTHNRENFNFHHLPKLYFGFNIALRTPARATITFDRQLHYLIILSPIQSNSKWYPHCRKNARDYNAVLTFAVRGPWTPWSSSNPFCVFWTFFKFFCGRGCSHAS